MVLIDTNIHAAYLLQNYEEDDETRRYLAEFTQLPLAQRVIADFVLNELELLLHQVVPVKYHLSEQQKRELGSLLGDYLQQVSGKCSLVFASAKEIKEAVALYQQQLESSYISFTDSLLLSLARSQQFKLLTKDKRLQEMANRLQIAYLLP